MKCRSVIFRNSIKGIYKYNVTQLKIYIIIHLYFLLFFFQNELKYDNKNFISNQILLFQLNLFVFTFFPPSLVVQYLQVLTFISAPHVGMFLALCVLASTSSAPIPLWPPVYPFTNIAMIHHPLPLPFSPCYFPFRRPYPFQLGIVSCLPSYHL